MADTLAADKGLMQVPAGGYGAVLAEVLAPWRARAGDAPILMSGMVGSRQGWVEAPYASLPARIEDLAAATVAVDAPGFADLAIVPGLAAGTDGTTWGDVMRGEETEVFGALAELGRRDATLVLPGSHAKWVRVKDGAVVSFETFMTGEVFDALARHTILSKMMPLGGDDAASFARGVAAGRELDAPGRLLTRLFNIRAETLFGRMEEAGAADFLSGLLIGAEVAAAAGDAREVVVVGAAGLAARYRSALDQMGIAAVAAPPQAAATGLRLIAAARAR
ncbi:MAG: hypothetical protein AcusKO_36290 [Acuticoccus sp.]